MQDGDDVGAGQERAELERDLVGVVPELPLRMRLTRGAAEQLATALGRPLSQMVIFRVGQAVAATPDEATAFAHRDAEYLLHPIAMRLVALKQAYDPGNLFRVNLRQLPE